MQFRVFSKAKVQNGIFLGVAKILIFFFGCLKFLIFFVNGRCLARAYV